MTKLKLKERQAKKMKNTHLLLGYLRYKIKNNNNYISVFAGGTGSGKSWAALSLGDMVDPNFSIDNVVFTPLDFIRRVDHLINDGQKGAVIIFDEAGTEGMSSRDWHSEGNKSINSLLQTFRSNNLILIITVPYASFIDSRARKLCDSIVQFYNGSVNKSDKISAAKIQKIQASQYNDKILMPYPKFKTRDGVIQVKSVAFPSPPRKLINEYEKRKADFNKHVRVKAESGMRPEQYEAQVDGVILTDVQKEIYDLYAVEGKSQKEIAEIRGVSPPVISKCVKAIEKRLRRKIRARKLNPNVSHGEVSPMPTSNIKTPKKRKKKSKLPHE